jgi:uncharacterized protein (TIGR03032 family)
MTTPEPLAAARAPEPWLDVTSSRDFADWLARQGVSLAFTSYQTGKLFLLGRKPDGKLAVFERTFNRCMGLWADGQTLWLASQYQLWRFENVLRPGETYEGHDRLYVPRLGHTTGDLDVHDERRHPYRDRLVRARDLLAELLAEAVTLTGAPGFP